jgi:hypothetical protein
VSSAKPSRESALRNPHKNPEILTIWERDAEAVVRVAVFYQEQSEEVRCMSRMDAVTLASRTLATLLVVWALSELTSLPGAVNSLIHYGDGVSVLSTARAYWLHHYLTATGFLVVRIVGFALTARWLYRGGPEVAELLLPEPSGESAAR